MSTIWIILKCIFCLFSIALIIELWDDKIWDEKLHRGRRKRRDDLD